MFKKKIIKSFIVIIIIGIVFLPLLFMVDFILVELQLYNKIESTKINMTMPNIIKNIGKPDIKGIWISSNKESGIVFDYYFPTLFDKYFFHRNDLFLIDNGKRLKNDASTILRLNFSKNDRLCDIELKHYPSNNFTVLSHRDSRKNPIFLGP